MIFTEAMITEALSHRCALCKAPPNAPCRNIATGFGLPDRTVHHYRIEPK